MLDKELLSILVCPESHQKLSLLGDDELAEINERIRSGDVHDRSGNAVSSPLDGGLIREDRQCFYKIIDGIPVLLIDEAVPLNAQKAN